MGTVGISFGSPTGGAGFDVAATVSQIVVNLKNVETPWTKQLTSLQSQDTALSSIGTLLSSLSTDIGNLTDFTGVMARKTGSSSNTNVLQLSSASSSATAGTHTVSVTSLAKTSSGYLTAITSGSDQLAGSISIQVGTGPAHKVNLIPSNKTLAGLAATINASGIGVTASVLTDSAGSRLSLVSGTSGANGTLTISSSITDTTTANAPLNYRSVVTGTDARLNVDGVDLTSASNTVSNLIPGVTFQLLSPSPTLADSIQESLQVVVGNENSGVETAINQLVSDYNALTAAINVQQGKDSSGNPEPLFGSPTLSLLRQQLLGGLNVQNPNGSLTSIAAGVETTLSGSMNIAVGGGVTDTIVIGAGTNTANVFYTGDGVNTVQGVADAINVANSGTTLGFANSADNTGGTLPAVATGNALSGSISFAVGTGIAQNIVIGYVPKDGPAANTTYTGSDSLTLAQLEATINDTPAFGVTANVTTDANGWQTLALTSVSGDALTANSSILAAGLGVSASVVTNSGKSTLMLLSHTTGSAGALDVTPSITATNGSNSTPLAYLSSSDISTPAGLGITASPKADGTLSFNVATLDAALNSDFSGVLGLFQSVNSWGQTFKTMLNNAGIGSTKGILALAEKSNSSMEKTLNDNLTREDAVIAAKRKGLTTQLNLANQILQSIPSQLTGINMLYSAITGYNQKNG